MKYLRPSLHFFTITTMFLGSFAFALQGPATKTPTALKKYTPEQNRAVFAQYCVGSMDSSDIPTPNYSNPAVSSAKDILSKLGTQSIVFYGPVAKIYKIPKSTDAQLGPDQANGFLTELCGEFKDRPSMIEAKVRWINNIYKLPITPQQPINMSKSVWSQMSAQSYSAYITLGRAVFTARQAQLSSKTITIGNSQLPLPVPAESICETKYIFSEYIVKGKSFDDLDTFQTGLNNFAGTNGNCTKEDKQYRYDFRGDANFKINSPESNAMIWYQNSLASHCASTNSAKAPTSGASPSPITDAVCQNYYKHPFESRWNAARQALAAWLFHGSEFDSVFANDSATSTMVPNFSGEQRPWGYSVASQDGSGIVQGTIRSDWNQTKMFSVADMGFNQVFNFGKGLFHFNSTPLLEQAYIRLRDSVNRHTNWYASGYDDGMSPAKTQAFSPFVASSYDASASDSFTAAGYTVPGAGDGFKQWMFVFRVRVDKWYNSMTMKNGWPVDFNENWFDETSIGTNGLARSEHAWDRVGTAMDDELDSILYLHNINTSGEITGDGLN